MSGTASLPSVRRFWLELLWGIFVAANLVAIVVLPHQVPIPFHFIWISLALVYGVRAWPLTATLITLAAVMVSSGAALAGAIARGTADHDEYPEILLMALVFLAMVLHVQRRQAANQEVKRLAEDRARVLEREQDFLRDASHQLRTPITVARGYAELMEQDCAELATTTGADTSRLSADAQVVIEELDRLTRLSDGLLLLAAAERPEFLRWAEVSVDELVDEVAARWHSVAHRRWRVDVVRGVRVYGDRQRLRTALDALMDNAIAFTTDDDEITLRVAPAGEDVVVEVADSGPGLVPAVAERAFERFVSDDTHRVAGRGTGLGLAAVRAVVEAHGGSVTATNRPEGGASFVLRLPSTRAVQPFGGALDSGVAPELGPAAPDLPPTPRDGAPASI